MTFGVIFVTLFVGLIGSFPVITNLPSYSFHTINGCQDQWFKFDTKELFSNQNPIVFKMTISSETQGRISARLTQNEPILDPSLSPSGTDNLDWTENTCGETKTISPSSPNVEWLSACTLGSANTVFYVIVSNLGDPTNDVYFSNFTIAIEGRALPTPSQVPIFLETDQVKSITVSAVNPSPPSPLPLILPGSYRWRFFYFDVPDKISKTIGAYFTVRVDSANATLQKDITAYLRRDGPAVPGLCSSYYRLGGEVFSFDKCQIAAGGRYYLTVDDESTFPENYNISIQHFEPTTILMNSTSADEIITYADYALNGEIKYYFLEVTQPADNAYLVITLDNVIRGNARLTVYQISDYYCGAGISCDASFSCAVTLAACSLPSRLLVTVSPTVLLTEIPLYFALKTKFVVPNPRPIGDLPISGELKPGDVITFTYQNELKGDAGNFLYFHLISDEKNKLSPKMTISKSPNFGFTNFGGCSYDEYSVCYSSSGYSCGIQISSCDLALTDTYYIHITAPALPTTSWEKDPIRFTVSKTARTDFEMITHDHVNQFSLFPNQQRYFELQPWQEGTVELTLWSSVSNLQMFIVTEGNTLPQTCNFKIEYPSKYVNLGTGQKMFIPYSSQINSKELRIFFRLESTSDVVTFDAVSRIETFPDIMIGDVKYNFNPQQLSLPSEMISLFLNENEDDDQDTTEVKYKKYIKYFEFTLPQPSISQVQTETSQQNSSVPESNAYFTTFSGSLVIELKSYMPIVPSETTPTITLYAVDSRDEAPFYLAPGDFHPADFDQSLVSISQKLVVNEGITYMSVSFRELLRNRVFYNYLGESRKLILKVETPFVGNSELRYGLIVDTNQNLLWSSSTGERTGTHTGYFVGPKISNIYTFTVTEDDKKNNRFLRVLAYGDKTSAGSGLLMGLYLNGPSFNQVSPNPENNLYQYPAKGILTNDIVVNQCDLEVGTYLLGVYSVTSDDPNPHPADNYDAEPVEYTLTVILEDSFVELSREVPLSLVLPKGAEKIVKFTLDQSFFGSQYHMATLYSDSNGDTISYSDLSKVIPDCNCQGMPFTFTNYRSVKTNNLFPCNGINVTYYLRIRGENSVPTQVSVKLVTATKFNTAIVVPESCTSADNTYVVMPATQKLLYLDISSAESTILYIENIEQGRIKYGYSYYEDKNCITSLRNYNNPVPLYCYVKGIALQAVHSGDFPVTFQYRICKTASTQVYKYNAAAIPITLASPGTYELDVDVRDYVQRDDEVLQLRFAFQNFGDKIQVYFFPKYSCDLVCGSIYKTFEADYVNDTFVYNIGGGCSYPFAFKFRVITFQFTNLISTPVNFQFSIGNQKYQQQIQFVSTERSRMINLPARSWSLIKMAVPNLDFHGDFGRRWIISANWTTVEDSRYTTNPIVMFSKNGQIPLPMEGTADHKAACSDPNIISLNRNILKIIVQDTTTCCNWVKETFIGIINEAFGGVTIDLFSDIIPLWVKKDFPAIAPTAQLPNIHAESLISSSDLKDQFSGILIKTTFPTINHGQILRFTLDSSQITSTAKLSYSYSEGCGPKISSIDLFGQYNSFSIGELYCTRDLQQQRNFYIDQLSNTSDSFTLKAAIVEPKDVSPPRFEPGLLSGGTAVSNVFRIPYQDLPQNGQLKVTFLADTPPEWTSIAATHNKDNQNLIIIPGFMESALFKSSIICSNEVTYSFNYVTGTVILDEDDICSYIANKNDYYIVVAGQTSSNNLPNPTAPYNISTETVPTFTILNIATHINLNNVKDYISLPAPNGDYYEITISKDGAPSSFSVDVYSSPCNKISSIPTSNNQMFRAFSCGFPQDKVFVKFGYADNYTITYNTRNLPSPIQVKENHEYSVEVNQTSPIVFQFKSENFHTPYKSISFSYNPSKCDAPSKLGTFYLTYGKQPCNPIYQKDITPSNTEISVDLSKLKVTYDPVLPPFGFYATFIPSSTMNNLCYPTVTLKVTNNDYVVYQIHQNEAVYLNYSAAYENVTDCIGPTNQFTSCSCSAPKPAVKIPNYLIQVDVNSFKTLSDLNVKIYTIGDFSPTFTIKSYSTSGSVLISPRVVPFTEKNNSIQISACAFEDLSQIFIEIYDITMSVAEPVDSARFMIVQIQNYFYGVQKVELSSTVLYQEYYIELASNERMHFFISNVSEPQSYPAHWLGYRIDVLEVGLRKDTYTVLDKSKIQIHVDDGTTPYPMTCTSSTLQCSGYCHSVNRQSNPLRYGYFIELENDKYCTCNPGFGSLLLSKCTYPAPNRFTIVSSNTETNYLTYAHIKISYLIPEVEVLDSEKCYVAPKGNLNPDADVDNLFQGNYYKTFIFKENLTNSSAYYWIRIKTALASDFSVRINYEQLTENRWCQSIELPSYQGEFYREIYAYKNVLPTVTVIMDVTSQTIYYTASYGLSVKAIVPSIELNKLYYSRYTTEQTDCPSTSTYIDLWKINKSLFVNPLYLTVSSIPTNNAVKLYVDTYPTSSVILPNLVVPAIRTFRSSTLTTFTWILDANCLDATRDHYLKFDVPYATNYSLILQSSTAADALTENVIANTFISPWTLKFFSFSTANLDSHSRYVHFNYWGESRSSLTPWMNTRISDQSCASAYIFTTYSDRTTVKVPQCHFTKGDNLLLALERRNQQESCFTNDVGVLVGDYTEQIAWTTTFTFPLTGAYGKTFYNISTKDDDYLILTFGVSLDDLSWNLYKNFLESGKSPCSFLVDVSNCIYTYSNEMKTFFDFDSGVFSRYHVLIDWCFHCGSAYTSFDLTFSSTLANKFTVVPQLHVLSPTTLKNGMRYNQTFGSSALGDFVYLKLDEIQLNSGLVVNFDVLAGKINVAIFYYKTGCSSGTRQKSTIWKKSCMQGIPCQFVYDEYANIYEQQQRETPDAYYAIIYGTAAVSVYYSSPCLSTIPDSSLAPFCASYGYQFPSSYINLGKPTEQDTSARLIYDFLHETIYTKTTSPLPLSEECLQALAIMSCEYHFPKCSNTFREPYPLAYETCTYVQDTCGIIMEEIQLPQFSCDHGDATYKRTRVVSHSNYLVPSFFLLLSLFVMAIN